MSIDPSFLAAKLDWMGNHCRRWASAQPRLIPFACQVRLLDLPLHGRVRKLEKRPAREAGDFVGSTPTSATSTVPWSNGKTPARHAGNDGSTPSGATRGLQVFRRAPPR